MKKILIIIICVLCLCGCSKSKKVDDEQTKESEKVGNNENNKTIEESADNTIEQEFKVETTAVVENNLSKKIVGNWHYWTSESRFANIGFGGGLLIPNSITFNNDSTFEYKNIIYNNNVSESREESVKGTYSVFENKISLFYNQSYCTSLECDKKTTDLTDLNFSLEGNEITIEGFGIYVKEGETLNPLPDCSDEYSKKLEGYYICTYDYDGLTEYFHFGSNGEINGIEGYIGTNIEYDYVFTDFTSDSIYGVVERCGGDSECGFSANYAINQDGSISLINDYGEQFGILTAITKEEFESVQKDTAYYIGNMYLIKADVLNVREQPSLSSKKVSTVNKGDICYASYEKKVEPVQADGYTWYFIGENEWIADKNGEWV